MIKLRLAVGMTMLDWIAVSYLFGSVPLSMMLSIYDNDICPVFSESRGCAKSNRAGVAGLRGEGEAGRRRRLSSCCIHLFHFV